MSEAVAGQIGVGAAPLAHFRMREQIILYLLFEKNTPSFSPKQSDRYTASLWCLSHRNLDQTAFTMEV
jgi:hypothetical protein